MMMRRLTAVAACVILSSVDTAEAQIPHVLGLWELNLAASDLPDQFPVASETRSYRLRDDGYLVVLAIRTDRNGNPEFIQVVAKSDGNEYPQYQSAPLAEFQIDGTTTPFTYSETVVDEYTVEAVARIDGRVTNSGTRRVSEDGSRMTLDVTAFLPDGGEIPFVLVFDRRG
jgi:hypothetical protein